MRATKLLVVSGIAIFGIFFLVAFLNLNERADIAGHAALGGLGSRQAHFFCCRHGVRDYFRSSLSGLS
jgi:hypothetical protein